CAPWRRMPRRAPPTNRSPPVSFWASWAWSSPWRTWPGDLKRQRAHLPDANRAGGRTTCRKCLDNGGTHEDLPPLYVDEDGSARHPVLAPRLKLADLQGRAIMIHAGGDNYADEPSKLGGGGSRVACGVVKGS